MPEFVSSVDWSLVLMSVVMGAFGGFVNFLLNPKTTKDLAWWGSLIIGAAGAVATFWAVDPQWGFKSFATYLIAGYAGKEILEAVKKRLIAAVDETNLKSAKAGIDAEVKALTDLQGQSKVRSDPVMQQEVTEHLTRVKVINAQLANVLKP